MVAVITTISCSPYQPREGGITESDLVALAFNREYLFHVRFHSDGHKELHLERFKFIAKSWDDITFQEA
ncbi:MAG: hypothetical protein WB988_04375 [Candidatus Nitrosopolaris sp.]